MLNSILRLDCFTMFCVSQSELYFKLSKNRKINYTTLSIILNYTITKLYKNFKDSLILNMNLK